MRNLTHEHAHQVPSLPSRRAVDRKRAADSIIATADPGELMDLPLLQELDDIRAKASADLAAASDEAALESWRIAYLGRRSRLNLILRGLASLPLDERRPVGAAANRLRKSWRRP